MIDAGGGKGGCSIMWQLANLIETSYTSGFHANNTSKIWASSLFSLINLLSIVIIFQCVISQSKLVVALPLHIDSRWIVNENGQRVKLA